MQVTRIKSIKSLGVRKTLDFEVDHPDHNFWANDIVISNSHSIAYSKLSALSVYLKFNKSQHFFLEALKLAKDKQDVAEEVATITQELEFFNIKLLPPSLTKSKREFSIEGDNLRFGLESIKGISEKSITHLQSFIDKDRTNLFQVFQAADQSKVNVTVLSALVECGCLEDVSPFDRQTTVLFLKIWKELSVKEKSYCIENGEKFNFDLILMLKAYLTWVGPNGKLLGKQSRLDTIRKNCAPAIQIWKENMKDPMISQYLFEKKLLGYCPSITLSELFKKYPDLSKISQIKNELYENERLFVVAEVKEFKSGTAKKSGNKYGKITISDETGTLDCLFTGDKWLNYVNKFGEPEEGQIIYIIGNKGKGEDFVIFGDRGEPQMLQIFQRVNDLKKYQAKHGIKPEEEITI